MDLEKIILDTLTFIGNINFASFGNILLFSLVIFWLVVVGWVWADSGERTTKTGARILYVLIVLVLNIPGLIIYLIVRPSETIEQIYWGDLERRYLKFETSDLGDCPSCCSQLYPGYVHCPNCGFELKKKCPSCDMLVNRDCKYCVYCGYQISKRLIPEVLPDATVMQQQILASKEQAAQTVEENRTRYKSGKSIVVKIGDSLLSFFGLIKESFNKKVEEVKTTQEQSAQIENSSKKKKKKKKKNKKR
jgi:hypothetical protein